MKYFRQALRFYEEFDRPFILKKRWERVEGEEERKVRFHINVIIDEEIG